MRALLKLSPYVLKSPVPWESQLSNRRYSLADHWFNLAPAVLLAAVCAASSAPSAQAQISSAGAQSVNFGAVNVCPSGTNAPAPCSATQTLSYKVEAGTTIGSIKILTLGSPNLDFRAKADDTSTTLCTPQTYPSATTCTVDVTFAPLHAGERNGAVQILDGSGNVLATTNIYGTGTAPAIAFSPANQLSFTGGPGFSFGRPSAVAMDGSGNLFVSDFKNNAVYEMPVAGGYTTVNKLGGARPSADPRAWPSMAAGTSS